MSTETTWRDIRALRANPPGLAQEAARRDVFTAALQQAEELHEAASVSGYASRPLPLFYAVSQGGRAIAAARRKSEDWELSGHGLKARTESPVGSTRLSPQSGAFRTLSEVTNSAEIGEGVTLAALVATLPELDRLLSSPVSHPKALGLELEYEHALGEHAILVPPFGHLAIYCGPEANLTDEDARRAAMEKLLGPYGRATGWGIASGIRYSAGRPCIALGWPVEDEKGQRGYRALETVATQVGEHFYLRPTLGPRDGEVSLLMTWWAALLALSSLARYEPSHWRAAIDVDASRDGVALQEILDVALQRVPELLYEALVEAPT